MVSVVARGIAVSRVSLHGLPFLDVVVRPSHVIETDPEQNYRTSAPDELQRCRDSHPKLNKIADLKGEV